LAGLHWESVPRRGHKGDERITIAHACLIQRCAIGWVVRSGFCDGTTKKRYNTTDVRLIQRFAMGQFRKDALVCAEVLGPP
jgi:hypothetical protein